VVYLFSVHGFDEKNLGLYLVWKGYLYMLILHVYEAAYRLV